LITDKGSASRPDKDLSLFNIAPLDPLLKDGALGDPAGQNIPAFSICTPGTDNDSVLVSTTISMEELFWRSFALRFFIKSDFNSVPLGQFSWFSFIFISILFGIEHQRWLVGIFAGMVYSGVLYRSKNLFDPILSHTITNFLLGMYVLSTHQWSFW